jgi:hypothetical protein
MIGAIGIFVIYHPARYLGRHGTRDSGRRRFWGRRSRKFEGINESSGESAHRLQAV